MATDADLANAVWVAAEAGNVAVLLNDSRILVFRTASGTVWELPAPHSGSWEIAQIQFGPRGNRLWASIPNVPMDDIGGLAQHSRIIYYDIPSYNASTPEDGWVGDEDTD